VAGGGRGGPAEGAEAHVRKGFTGGEGDGGARAWTAVAWSN
jgi:hypothetical protein